MSAPDTNVKKQEDHHKPALLGIKGVMLFGILMLLIVIFLAVMRSDDPAPTTGSETSPVAVDPIEPGTNVAD